MTEALGRPGANVAAVLAALDAVTKRITETQAALTEASLGRAGLDLDVWPDDVEGRHALVGIVVREVVIERSATRGGAYEPNRVRIVPT